jgi:hypothetical protein
VNNKLDSPARKLSCLISCTNLKFPCCKYEHFSLARIAVSNPAGLCMSFFCDCCVLSERCLCDGLFSHPEESDRVVCLCVFVCVTECVQEKYKY